MFGPIRQTAYLVDDIADAAARWTEVYGVGPFFRFHVDIDDTTFRGRPTRTVSEMALAQSGVQQVELIQPVSTEPSLYREFLEQGRSGVHHICFWGDIDEMTAHLVGTGAEVVQDGVTANGSRFSYLSSDVGAPYVELLDPAAGGGGMARFFDMVAAAAVDWDGTDPLRAL